MARKIEYDKVEFLNGSTRLFLEKGYSKTSMRDILERTNMNRHSLYEHFGDKQTLYSALLNHYSTNFFRPLYEILESELCGMKSIDKFFLTILSTKGPINCVMHNVIVEVDEMEKSAIDAAKKHFRRIEKAIVRNLQIEFRNLGRPEKEVEALAVALLVFLKGLPSASTMYPRTKLKLAYKQLTRDN